MTAVNEQLGLVDEITPLSTTSNDADFKAVLTTLESAIRWLRWAAIAVFIVAGISSIIAVSILPSLTHAAGDEILKSKNSANMMLFQLLRGAAFAAAVTSILFGLFTLGRACLDQATRFQKRLIAAHFLNYVLEANQKAIESGEMSLNDVMKFLKAWSANVESAFTHVKFGSRRSQNTKVSGPGGMSAETGSTS
jgi:hypothetical protein